MSAQRPLRVTPEHIRESNLIEGIDDPTADAVGEAAWCWLEQQHYAAYTPDLVQHLHRIVTAAQWEIEDHHRGAWRTVNVRVGNHVAPDQHQVQALMERWCIDLAVDLGSPNGPSITARQAHVEFERIHPFVDGNGRTGRLLLWFHQQALGERPTLIRAVDRRNYYRWFQPHHETTDQPAGLRST